MDDYYELLGVDEDTPVDDIRSTYRDKKAAVDTSANDEAKSDVAKLNKAWNVLSDPYQYAVVTTSSAPRATTPTTSTKTTMTDAPVVVRKPSSRANDRAERRNENHDHEADESRCPRACTSRPCANAWSRWVSTS